MIYCFLMSMFLTSISLELAQAQAPTVPDLQRSSETIENCLKDKLRRVGFQFQENAEASTINLPGNVCRSNNRNIVMPGKSSSQKKVETLYDFATSYEAYCGFQKTMSKAMDDALKKISQNQNYKFGGYPDIYPASWKYGVARVLDDGRSSFGYSFGSLDEDIQKKISAIYLEPVKFDCAIGAEFFQIASISELFGRHLNSLFKKKHFLTVMNGSIIRDPLKSPSFTTEVELRRLTGRIKQQDKRSHLSLLGKAGVILSLLDESHLDSPNDVNENFVILKTTEKAYHDYSQSLSKVIVQGEEELVYAFPQEIWKRLKSALDSRSLSSELQRQAENLVQSKPFLTETEVYVHPLGKMTLAQHIIRLLQVNPRMPYVISMNEGIFPVFETSEGSFIAWEGFNPFFSYFTSCIENTTSL